MKYHLCVITDVMTVRLKKKDAKLSKTSLVMHYNYIVGLVVFLD